MAARAEVKTSAATVLRLEGAVVRLRAVVRQIAVDDEVGNVLDQLATPRQHSPGEEKQQRDGDEATHNL